MTLGQKLKEHREHYGLTTREMGRLLGVSYSLVNKLENDKRTPSLPYLYRLQLKLDLSSRDFQELKIQSGFQSYYVKPQGNANIVWDIKNLGISFFITEGGEVRG